MKKILYIVIPCFNESEVLLETTKRLDKKIKKMIKDKKISTKSKIMYINDGSKDNTWDLIEKISMGKDHFTGISLSKNMGHQNALLAGLLTAKEYADIVISMDADLQDDIEAIDEMIDKYYNGFNIVYGVRRDRKKDSMFKKLTAQYFYKFMKLLGADIIYNHADFRLMDKKTINYLENFGEVNLFLRGIIPLIGFKSDIVYYSREKRYAGKSKYSLKKMLNFAWDGITSFSIKPMRLILNLGIFMLIFSIFMIMYSLILKLKGITVDGWTYIMCSIWMIAGIQMMSIGILGEYIGKIYSETKKRPRYIISRNLLEEDGAE